jgi:hypothetical protein
MLTRCLATAPYDIDKATMSFFKTNQVNLGDPAKKAQGVNNVNNDPKVESPLLTKEEGKKLHKAQRNDKIQEAGLYQAIHNLRHNSHR